MERRIAKIISIVLHPLFVPTYGAMLLLATNPFFAARPLPRGIILTFFFVCTCLIPLTLSLFLYDTTSLERLERKNRHILYVTTLISYIGCFVLLRKINAPLWTIVMFAGCLVPVFLLTLINFFWKISAHAVAAGCFVGYVFWTASLGHTNPVGLFLLSITLCGAIGWARLALGRHTLSQVLAGYALGLSVPLASLYIFLF